ncbi:MAG: ABC transporter permease [Bacillota bacterium]
MFIRQLKTEFSRYFTFNNVIIPILIILFLPTLMLFIVKDKYILIEPIDAFQQIFSQFIPLLFPVICIIIYLPFFSHELKNGFIKYVQPRMSISTYLMSKYIVNVTTTGITIFSMLFLTFIYVQYIDPFIGLIEYTPNFHGENAPEVTFSQIIKYGDLVYGVIYSIWVALNAIIYSTVAYLLLLILKSNFIALSAPFLFYHVFNFITGVLGEPKFHL